MRPRILSFDVVDGKKPREFAGNIGFAETPALAPDGSFFVRASPFPQMRTALVDTHSGKVRRTLHGAAYPVVVQVSPSGQWIAGLDLNGRLHFWETGTGRIVHPLNSKTPVQTMAFSTDANMLATSDKRRSITIWEFASREPRLVLRGHQKPIVRMAFISDGRRLASADAGGLVRIWDLQGRSLANGEAASRYSKTFLQSEFNRLTSKDAATAFQAMSKLMQFPNETVALLESRLRPVPHDAPKDVEQLIRKLNSDHFRVRSQAIKALKQRGETVEPYLRKALNNPPTLEASMRLQRLLSLLRSRQLNGDELRLRRAVELLGRISTNDARRLLAQLAAGAPMAASTRNAAAALARLPKMESTQR